MNKFLNSKILIAQLIIITNLNRCETLSLLSLVNFAVIFCCSRPTSYVGAPTLLTVLYTLSRATSVVASRIRFDCSDLV